MATKYKPKKSKFFPNKDTISGINIENVIKTKSERITSSCLNDPDQEFITTTFKQPLPDWIKNNAGWWANGDIDEKEFLSALDFLLSNEILRINIPRDEFHMELDSQTYYVNRYNSDEIKISGWYEGRQSHYPQPLDCELWKPDSTYSSMMNTTFTDEINISRSYTDDHFEQNII